MSSIRQRIIAAWADALRASGQFQHVEDAEPYNYERAPLPACWVIEGNESIDHAQVFGKAVCDLTVIVQVAYRYDSADPQASLYRRGREHLARLQATVMNAGNVSDGSNAAWGGHALLTLEQGNAIGRLESEDKPFGVLTTEWVVRYRRDTFDPTKR